MDDSDDEGGPAVPVAAVTTSAPALVATNKKKVAPKAVVEPSIPDERYVCVLTIISLVEEMISSVVNSSSHNVERLSQEAVCC